MDPPPRFSNYNKFSNKITDSKATIHDIDGVPTHNAAKTNKVNNTNKILETGQVTETDIVNNMTPTPLPQPKTSSQTGYAGVYTSKDRYRAEITIKGVTHRLGRFKTLEQAVKARKEAYQAAFEAQKL